MCDISRAADGAGWKASALPAWRPGRLCPRPSDFCSLPKSRTVAAWPHKKPSLLDAKFSSRASFGNRYAAGGPPTIAMNRPSVAVARGPDRLPPGGAPRLTGAGLPAQILLRGVADSAASDSVEEPEDPASCLFGRLQPQEVACGRRARATAAAARSACNRCSSCARCCVSLALGGIALRAGDGVCRFQLGLIRHGITLGRVRGVVQSLSANRPHLRTRRQLRLGLA